MRFNGQRPDHTRHSISFVDGENLHVYLNDPFVCFWGVSGGPGSLPMDG